MQGEDGTETDGPGRFERRWSLTFGGEVITRVAWSPDGEVLAVPTQSGVVRLVGLDGQVTKETKVSPKALWTSAWSADGRRLAVAGRDNTVHVLDVRSGTEALTLSGHTDDVHAVGWGTDDAWLFSASYDGTLRTWNARTGQMQRTIAAHEGRIEDAYWSGDDGLVHTGGRDGRVRSWNPDSGAMAAEITAHQGFVIRVLGSPTAASLFTAASDGTVRVWDRRDLRLLHTIQGFSGVPHDLSLSDDGKLLAVQDDATNLWVYRADTFELLELLTDVADHHHWYGSSRFHPSLPYLASTGEADRAIGLRSYDSALVEELTTESASSRYANCRVAVLGNTGVGKTALSRALCGKEFQATESTHGTQVSLMDRHIGLDQQGTVVREVFLWDFAGQSVYRLMQQSEATDIAIALLVLDNRNAVDPLSEIREWETLLRLGTPPGAAGPKRVVVVARTDRGSVGLQSLADDWEREVESHVGTLETSAREGVNIGELRELILGAIDWSEVPTLTSNSQFQQLRAFILQQTSTGRIMEQTRTLFREFCRACTRNGVPEPALTEFRALLSNLDAEGLVHRLRFGDLVLLKPTLVGSYASMLVIAAQRVPEGDGTLSEDDVLAGRVPLLDKDRVADRRHEEDIVHAAVQELLNSGAVVRDAAHGLLRFPSAVRRTHDELAWERLAGRTGFRARALADHVHASLIAGLEYSGLFDECALWSHVARFRRASGSASWVRVRPNTGGMVQVDVRHDAAATTTERGLFEELCRSQLSRVAVGGAVDSVQTVVCPSCTTGIGPEQVRRRRERGFDWITCGVCDTRIDFTQKPVSPERTPEVRAIETSASRTRTQMLRSADVALKEKRRLYDVFVSYSHADQDAAAHLSQRLREHGIRPWLDLWETSPGTPWIVAIQDQLETMPCAAVLIGPSGVGPWQRDEVWYVLQEFLGRRCPVIPVLLAGAAQPEVPVLLRNMQWVDFNRELPDPMHLLLWGITGVHPDERSA
ncbi:TIR domain-containing protein [Streptomyces sp. NPDC088194]|uniref:TIR domain-containing protein n=1 Tax=Streptomyces sp. NPDC088194 TaxID=3154931 RepID=UPI00344BDB90